MEIDNYNWDQINGALSTIDQEKYSERYSLLIQRRNELQNRLESVESEYEELTGKGISATLSSKTREMNTKQIFSISAYGTAIPFALVALFAILGANTVSWGNEYLHDVFAIVVCAIFWLPSWIIFSLFQLLGAALRDLIHGTKNT